MAVSTKGLTAADLLELFGPMPAGRIRTDPPPGTATEQDVIDIEARESRLCELVDGVLVEKTVGYYESYLAGKAYRIDRRVRRAASSRLRGRRSGDAAPCARLGAHS